LEEPAKRDLQIDLVLSISKMGVDVFYFLKQSRVLMKILWVNY